MMFKPIAWAIPNRRINPSRALIRAAAELQYKQAAVRPNASLKEHLGEFDSLWGFFDDLWPGVIGQRAVEAGRFADTSRARRLSHHSPVRIDCTGKGGDGLC